MQAAFTHCYPFPRTSTGCGDPNYTCVAASRQVAYCPQERSGMLSPETSFPSKSEPAPEIFGAGWLSNMSFSTKTFLGFAVVVLLSVASMAMAYVGYQKIRNNF